MRVVGRDGKSWWEGAHSSRAICGSRLVKSATMKYPSIAEVIAADHEYVSFWWNFLPDPETPVEERVLDLVFKRFYVSGDSSNRNSPSESDERQRSDASQKLALA